MKMFLTLLFLFSGASSGFAQDSHDEIIQKFLKQRKSMMEDILKAFDDDEFFKDDFFQDDMFEALKNNGIGAFKGFQGAGDNVSVEERMEEDGSISVIITPQNENDNLDIITKENEIIIKSETKLEDENVQGQSRSKSISTRSYTRKIGIPQGYEAKSPVKEGKAIVISLVPENKKFLKPNKDGKVPLKKRDGEETI